MYYDENICFEYACQSGDLDYVWFMMNLVKPNIKMLSFGLRGACRGAHHTLVDYLLNKGAVINETVLTRAIDGGNISIIKILLDKGVKIRKKTNINVLQDAPMYAAGKLGNIQIINRLLKIFNTKKDIDFCMSGACYGGNNNVIDQMISLGASDWSSAFSSACCGKQYIIAKMLIEHIIDFRRIFARVCGTGNLDFIKFVISCDVNVIPECSSGITMACRNGHIDVVKYLLELGGNPKPTAFRVACLCKQYDIVMILIEYMIKNKIEYCDSGLVSSCMSGDIKLIHLMIEKGATSFNKGLTEGCRRGYDKVIQCMIEHGATQCEHCNLTIEQHMGELKYEMILV
jgi:ankyrin repeat protein